MRNSRMLSALTQLLLLLPALPALGLSQPAQGISIGDLTKQEGTGGTDAFLFVVSVQSSQQVTMSVSATSGTARVGTGQQCQAGDDVILPQDAITIPASTPSVILSVTICQDNLDEADSEQFTINLSGASGANIVDGTATGTITDNDDMPRLSVTDANANEGNAGSPGSAAFQITLNTASGREVTVVFDTQGGNATEGAGCGGNVDYVSRNAPAVFAPGVTQQTVTISYCGDALVENNETFSLVLSAQQNATIQDGTGAGRINNDDLSVIAIAVPLTDTRIEGTPANTPGTLVLTNSVAQPSTINISVTATGTALVGTACTGAVDVALPAQPVVVQWGPNDASPKSVTYTICGDASDDEDVETLILTLTAAAGAAAIAPAASSMTLSITDDDASPTITVQDRSVTEPGTGAPLSRGTGQTPVTFTLSAASNRVVSMTVASKDLKAPHGTGILPATGGSSCGGQVDYVSSSHVVSFAARATTRTGMFTICGDGQSEGTGSLGSLLKGKEMFQVVASSPSNATLAKAIGLILILDP